MFRGSYSWRKIRTPHSSWEGTEPPQIILEILSNRSYCWIQKKRGWQGGNRSVQVARSIGSFQLCQAIFVASRCPFVGFRFSCLWRLLVKEKPWKATRDHISDELLTLRKDWCLATHTQVFGMFHDWMGAQYIISHWNTCQPLVDPFLSPSGQRSHLSAITRPDVHSMFGSTTKNWGVWSVDASKCLALEVAGTFGLAVLEAVWYWLLGRWAWISTHLLQVWWVILKMSSYLFLTGMMMLHGPYSQYVQCFFFYWTTCIYFDSGLLWYSGYSGGIETTTGIY